jgi:Cysteine rich repeat
MKIDLLGRAIGAAALCISLVFAGSAYAAPSCKADVAQFCPQVHPGGGRIAQCLKENEAQLSDSCKERVKMAAARLKEVKEACADDVQQYCAGVKMGEGRVAHCLKQHEDKLSAECKTEIADLLEKQ